jgi:hypothetical protein
MFFVYFAAFCSLSAVKSLIFAGTLHRCGGLMKEKSRAGYGKYKY